MDHGRLFLVRVWAGGHGPHAAAREVASESTAVFDDALSLGAHLMAGAGPAGPAAHPVDGPAPAAAAGEPAPPAYTDGPSPGQDAASGGCPCARP